MKKPGLMIALGVPKDSKDDGEDLDKQREDCATRIIDAVKSGDKQALLDALDHLNMIGAASSDDDDDEDGEDY